MCGKCSKSSENHSTCEHCGNSLVPEVPHLYHPPAAQPTSPTPRPPIRPHPHTHQHPSPGANNLQLRKNSFYGSASTLRALPLRVDTVMNPPIPVRITTRAGLLLPHNGRPVGAGLVGSCCAGKVAANKGRRTAAAKLHKINDPSKSTDPSRPAKYSLLASLYSGYCQGVPNGFALCKVVQEVFI